ncbi:hypothetical protein BV20DRAFT_957382 [Pilatotrama ljubarskyi]|nr:hypothetical protein BV20DRAFT_957382 [Pilatotrama ljubarskyi]
MKQSHRHHSTTLIVISLSSSKMAACPQDIDALILSQIQLGPTIGVAYLGVAISSTIYGITCIQTFQYYRSPKGRADRALLRFIVRYVPALAICIPMILDSAHQALIVQILYHYLILNYANPTALLRTVWYVSSHLLQCLSPVFFVMRIWKRTNEPWYVPEITVRMSANSGMLVVFPIRSFFYPLLVEAEEKLKPTGSAGLGVAVLADVTISVAMVWCLRKGRTGFRKSDDMIDRLIVLTITTGLLTTLFVIANLIAYLAAPSQLYNLLFNFMLGKFYINSLLTSLNTRGYVRGGNLNDVSRVNSVPLSTVHAETGHIASSQFTNATSSTVIAVSIVSNVSGSTYSDVVVQGSEIKGGYVV